jgi:hypothetical protein
MATHDYVIDNQTAPNFRADLNSALAAIVTQNSNATAPSVTYADMFWYDTTNNQLKKRNEANSAWITLGTVDEGTGTFTPSGGGAIASQAEAEAGTNNTNIMTPLRVFQAMKSLTIDVQEFDASGTWTKPTDAIYSEITVVGGGRAGQVGVAQAMCVTPVWGAGGAAGGGAVLVKVASALGATETVTIGAGGASSGASGGTSSFGSHASATGGGASGGAGSGTGAQAITGSLGGAGESGDGSAVDTLGGSSIAGPGGRSSSAGTRGGGGGGGAASATFGAGGAGYVRVVTYCA